MSGFYWIASYPRSGSTWLRLALRSLAAGGAPIDLRDDTSFAPNAARRDRFDALLSVESTDLTAEEVAVLRPRAAEAEAREAREPLLRKVHDAWEFTPAGEPLFPPSVTCGAVYVVRDPRDVAVSFAAHLGISIDATVALMNNPNAQLSPGHNHRSRRALPQRLLTWSDHVVSWLDNSCIEPLVLRYEDMMTAPERELCRIADYLGWRTSDAVVIKAVGATRFDVLRRQESEHGFVDRPAMAVAFFRSGRAGSWREILTQEQATRLVTDHYAMMQRLRFL